MTPLVSMSCPHVAHPAGAEAPLPGQAPADTAAPPFTQAELLRIAEFLQATSAQLTAHGIARLRSNLRAGEHAVFFRNNHFNTLYKHPETGELFILVTDAGYQDQAAVAWERLDNERGDTTYVTAGFEEYARHEARHREEQDALVAKLCADEQARRRCAGCG